ncbi:MAG: PIG-L family deacetylase [Candidatus Nanoarchaeia archaeon]|nr:PIG-L family deacetylase [Candidatus Nanoarchaeia archaeon]
MDKTEALAVVAHPDDETIWMAGVILRNKNWNWTVLSLCREYDSDRKPKFDKACKILNATSIIADLEDDNLQPIKTQEVILKIKEKLPKNSFDIIFTHGENGEYGHIRHIEIHNAVKSMIKNKDLTAPKVYFFNYKKGENILYPELKTPQPIEYSDFVLNLSDKELELKKKIIREIYKYQNEKGFELMSCNKMESFELMR